MQESLLKKLMRVKPKDIFQFFLFLIAILPAVFFKRKRKHLWLVCEKPTEANDNGYSFFCYLRKNQPQIDAVYAIDQESTEYPKVSSIGKTVPFGTLKHWIYYLAAEVNISSQKDGKPDAAVCYLLEVILRILKTKAVFLQHGVIKDDLPFLHREKTNFDIFCCGALPEYQYVQNNFGYINGEVRYTGLCRFDELHGIAPDSSLLLIFPTWRMDLQRSANMEAFLESDYYANWKKLLESEKFKTLLTTRSLHAVFCIHRNMSSFETAFDSLASECISVVHWQDADITSLIRRAFMLITDFSSVAMDFAYMKRPIIYYQFDYKHFRETHMPLGYYDYVQDGFGPVASTADQIVEEFEKLDGDRNYYMKYCEERTESFFTLYDTDNCKRTYEAILSIV